MARTPNELRNGTLNALLNRLDVLQTTQEESGEHQERAYRREIGRIRDLLSQYCGRPNPSRDLYRQCDGPGPLLVLLILLLFATSRS